MTEQEERMILAFGDSITMGAWDSQGGWANRLCNGKTRIVYNLGIDGNTVLDLLGRLELEVVNRGADKNSVIILAIGLNDSSRVNGQTKVDIVTFALTYHKLITLAQKYSDNVFCMGLTPINESKTKPVCWDETLSFAENDCYKFDIAIRAMVEEAGAEYIELPQKTVTLSDDGVHPDGEGHRTIAAIVNSKLQESISS